MRYTLRRLSSVILALAFLVVAPAAWGSVTTNWGLTLHDTSEVSLATILTTINSNLQTVDGALLTSSQKNDLLNGAFDPITGDNSETIDNQTDDIWELQGVGGVDDTDLAVDLDGIHPVLYSPTDDTIGFLDYLAFGNVTTAGTLWDFSAIDTAGDWTGLKFDGAAGFNDENDKYLDFGTDGHWAAGSAFGSGITTRNLFAYKYYDRDNGSYYVEPAATSVMAGITTYSNADFTLSADGTGDVKSALDSDTHHQFGDDSDHAKFLNDGQLSWTQTRAGGTLIDFDGVDAAGAWTGVDFTGAAGFNDGSDYWLKLSAANYWKASGVLRSSNVYVGVDFYTPSILSESNDAITLQPDGTGDLKSSLDSDTHHQFGDDTDYALFTEDGRFAHSVGPDFTADDTTPSVAGGNVFKTSSSHTAPCTITALDDGLAGQQIIIIGNDGANATTLSDAGTLKLSANWTGSSDATITLVFDGANWYETGRSSN